jgi:hypothetical protein
VTSDLPPWLAQVVAVLSDGQNPAAATDWMRRIHDELERLDGRVPFSVVHDWQANTVAPMLVEAGARRGGAAALQQSVQALHARALAGERVAEAEWIAALEPALRELYRDAYAYADAYATARTNALAYANANGFSENGAIEFADGYAKLNTSANVRSYADANAIANARALAAAYATADAQAYTECYPFAYVHACAYATAHAGQDEQHDTGITERHRAAYAQLADGLADSLARAAP